MCGAVCSADRSGVYVPAWISIASERSWAGTNYQKSLAWALTFLGVSRTCRWAAAQGSGCLVSLLRAVAPEAHRGCCVLRCFQLWWLCSCSFCSWLMVEGVWFWEMEISTWEFWIPEMYCALSIEPFSLTWSLAMVKIAVSYFSIGCVSQHVLRSAGGAAGSEAAVRAVFPASPSSCLWRDVAVTACAFSGMLPSFAASTPGELQQRL